jgi:hypothetical protein
MDFMKIGMLSFKTEELSGFKRKPYQFIGLKKTIIYRRCFALSAETLPVKLTLFWNLISSISFNESSARVHGTSRPITDIPMRLQEQPALKL